MGGDSGDESRQTISAAQLLSMGSCSAEEIGHIRLIVAWGNAFPAGTDGLSAMLELLVAPEDSVWFAAFEGKEGTAVGGSSTAVMVTGAHQLQQLLTRLAQCLGHW